MTTPVHVDSELPATTKSDLPLDPSVYSHFPTSISSNATLQDRLYDSCHPLIVTDDTPYYFGILSSSLLYCRYERSRDHLHVPVPSSEGEGEDSLYGYTLANPSYCMTSPLPFIPLFRRKQSFD